MIIAFVMKHDSSNETHKQQTDRHTAIAFVAIVATLIGSVASEPKTDTTTVVTCILIRSAAYSVKQEDYLPL